jgi:dihydroneopterin aldolase
MTGEGPGRDRIEIRDLRVVGVHGVLPEELERAQPFSLDIVAWVDMAAAQRSDDLADTVDYGALAQTAADVVGQQSFRLLEALAGRLADALLISDSRLEAVEVTVRKLRPPLALQVASTGVRVLRTHQSWSTAIGDPL